MKLSTISRGATESMKTAKSRSSNSQIKLVPATRVAGKSGYVGAWYDKGRGKGFVKEEGMIETRFYAMSLGWFVEETKRKRGEGEKEME